MLALTTFGLKISVQGSHTKIISTKVASHVLKILPKFPGFSMLSAIKIKGSFFCFI